jgi:hypothetical protein
VKQEGRSVSKPEKPQPLLEERRRLTFEQAEGVEPLPAQLRLRELSQALTAALWAELLESIENSKRPGHMGYFVRDPWLSILKDYHIYRKHRMADEFRSQLQDVLAQLKELVQQQDYARVLGFFQFVIRHSKCPYNFDFCVEHALRVGRAAYRVIDQTIVPIGSEIEKETVERAFANLAATEFHGARQHLRNAAEELTGGASPASIRESIHAVESVVRVLEPRGDFAKALVRLDAKVGIHGAMKAGFSSLYGFTSDEKGIRHPLLDSPTANVDETDALFMIGACAAFVSYPINKSRAAGLLD